MKTATYLEFNSNAREVIEVYKRIFDAEVVCDLVVGKTNPKIDDTPVVDELEQRFMNRVVDEVKARMKEEKAFEQEGSINEA